MDWRNFVMETIISSIIAGLFALVALVFGELFLGRKLNEKLTEHMTKEESNNDRLLCDHTNLSKENINLCGNLSKEHIEIKFLQNSIKEKQVDIFNLINQDKIEKLQAFDKMTDKQKELNDYLNKFQLFINDWQRQTFIIERLEKDIAEVKEQNIELAEENINLKEQIRNIKSKNRNRDRELER